MANLVTVENGKISVDSKTVADTFGKVHRNVMRDIENLECSDSFRALNFEQSSYVSLQGKTLPCVTMTKNGFYFLAMGFTGGKAAEWKEAFIEAFEKMEKSLNESGKSAMDALGEAVALMESDKDKASFHGKALSRWRSIRKGHVEAITAAHAKAQLVLNFKPV